eukprot:9493905-Alexandrium_andersonii.AAC.1
MSASLVGSEMCIRDRPRPKSGLATCARVARPAAGVGHEVCVGRRGHSAVSYTHLTLPTICSV